MGCPSASRSVPKIRAPHLHGRKLDRLDAVEPDERDRKAAGDQRHPVAGAGEAPGQRRRAGEVPGPEEMRDRDQDPQAHAASGAWAGISGRIPDGSWPTAWPKRAAMRAMPRSTVKSRDRRR